MATPSKPRCKFYVVGGPACDRPANHSGYCEYHTEKACGVCGRSAIREQLQEDWVRFICHICAGVKEPEQSPSRLVDSGQRVTYGANGAMRETTPDKGRFDLLPLQQIAEFLLTSQGQVTNPDDPTRVSILADVYHHMNHFIHSGDKESFIECLNSFAQQWPEKERLHNLVMLPAQQMAIGAEKYKERNWEKGMPVHLYVDSALRHILKWAAGLTDESHAAAFLWNMWCLKWTLENRPDQNDLPYNKTKPAGMTTRQEPPFQQQEQH